MFGSQSSRRRPSAKWNIKLTYRWIMRVYVCACVRCVWVCVCVCRLIFVDVSGDLHITLCPMLPHTVNMHTYTHFWPTFAIHKQQGVRRGRATNMCMCMCMCVCVCGALGRESNVKLVFSSCQIIHDPTSEMIAEWLDLSSPRSLSLSPMNHVLFKCHTEQKLLNKYSYNWHFSGLFPNDL